MTRKSVRVGIIGLVVVLAWSAIGLAAETGLSDAIEQIVAGAGKMSVGVRVEALGPRPAVIFERNSNELFQPASNQKIITTAAAMCLLPPDFSYRTILALRGNDLVIIGAGDPSCGDPLMAQEARQPITAMFHEWAGRLKSAGITTVRGNLLFDDSIFDDEYVLESWKKQFNLLASYSAPIGGLNFNDNCVGVVIKPGDGEIGSAADVSLVPGTSWITLENTAKKAKSGEPLVKRLGKGPLTITVSGSVSKANDPRTGLSIPITDPGMFFATACRTSLAAQGITIHGETRRARIRLASGALPPDLKQVAVHERKLSEILWRVNKSSLNMFAEGVLKTLGAYAGREAAPGVGSYATGRAAIQRFLDVLGVPRDSYVIDDGSGLSHGNRVTPAMITAILKHMNNHPRRDEWWANLAVPGEQTGTLRRRMRDLAGQVFAKTGHIGGVSTLSGYVVGQNKQVYVFSVLCNDTNKTKGSPHSIQDGICRKLASWGATASTRSGQGG